MKARQRPKSGRVCLIDAQGNKAGVSVLPPAIPSRRSRAEVDAQVAATHTLISGIHGQSEHLRLVCIWIAGVVGGTQRFTSGMQQSRSVKLCILAEGSTCTPNRAVHWRECMPHLPFHPSCPPIPTWQSLPSSPAWRAPPASWLRGGQRRRPRLSAWMHWSAPTAAWWVLCLLCAS